MKRILTFAVIVLFLLSYSSSYAQCSGGNVSVTNVSLIQSGTVVSYSFDWEFVQGNASIETVFFCDGVQFNALPCIPRLKDSTAGLHVVSGSFTNTCTGNVTMEVRVWSSNDCGGTYCVVFNTLPVKLKSFTTVRNQSNVVLKWETVIEERNLGFDVQRFIGSGNWESVGFVSSKANDGYSFSPLNYEFNDINTIKGITQYRLKQIDKGGKFEYSLIRSIRGEGQTGKVTVYPNPSNTGKVNVVFDDANVTRDVTLIDMNGRTIRQWRSITNNNIAIENLNAGFYSVIILNKETGQQEVGKIVVQ